MRSFGIVNLTRDSFSDGGRWFTEDAAIAHAERLLAAGAHVLDLGAESTHPDAENVPADQEIARLRPVVDALRARGAAISIDTRKPAVMQAMLERGVQWLNDVNGFRSDAAMQVVASAPASVSFVAMFSRSADGRASRGGGDVPGLLAAIRAFCRERTAAFAAAGVARERLVLDPGMGFFVGPTAAASLHVLAHTAELQREFAPLLVSVSRKAFLGEVAGAPVAERGAATIAAELWLARAGIAWIRTHDVKALHDAWSVEQAIAGAR
jgi:dihydropteroate synthase type 2